MNIDGLIFDLDGTLWDASESCIMAWNSALEKMHIKDFRVTPELASNFSGKLLYTIFAEYLSFLPQEKWSEMAAVYEHEETIYMKKYGGDLYTNTRAALERLSKEYKLFIVSNCMNGYIENFFRLHGLADFFNDYSCSGVTGKPKAENIFSLRQKNGLKNPVYIGDTPGDQQASAENNIPFIYARYGFGKISNAEFIIDDLMELKDVLKNISPS
ncbi:MAG: HAD family hydrolase [Bacteroidetes bacterium]|nr:HAD family hydrolase [Bacteroidota bacterium]